jgi:glycosyltransferase involved in cell wall biosynthesis
MISVCLASYNGALYIQEQLDSILQQLGPKDEVIVSDDCSGDATCDIIRDIKDDRIRLYQHSINIGPIKNFEFALQKASGDMIFLSDQDDIWMPGKVSTIVSLLQEYHLICHNAAILEDFNLPKEDSKYSNLFERYQAKSGILKNILKNSYTGCCMAFRRDVLKLSLPFPQYISMHDQWIGLVANSLYKVLFWEKNLIQYRRHSSNVTQWNKTPSKLTPTMFTKRFYLSFSLFKRYISFSVRKSKD